MRGILATTVSFCKYTAEPIAILEQNGFEIIRDYGLKGFKDFSEEKRRSIEAIVVGLEKIDAAMMDLLPNLKIIAKHGAGMDNIDMAAAKQRNIQTCNFPGANSNAVADITLGLMLDVSRMITRADRSVRSGKWERFYGTELTGKTLSIIGFGAIGQAVAKRAMGFGMNILAYDVEQTSFDGVQFVKFEEAIVRGDYITLHVPLLESTRNMINKQTIALMKKTAFIINAARGGLIDETALIAALENHTIAGAALDVFENEHNIDPKYFTLENIVLTPHIAGFSEEAINTISIGCTAKILECCK